MGVLSATLVFYVHASERQTSRDEHAVADPRDRIEVGELLPDGTIGFDPAIAFENAVHDDRLKSSDPLVSKASGSTLRET